MGRIQARTLWSLRAGLWRKPEVEGLYIYPQDKSLIEPGWTFSPDMFAPGGFLHETPLNHYVKVRYNKVVTIINAGYLIHHFIISDKLGYAEIARLIKRAKDQTPTPATRSSEEEAIGIQEEVPADTERGAGSDGRDSGEGERPDHPSGS